MYKYWLVFKIQLQTRFAYRFHMFLAFFLRLIPTFVLILVWGRVTADNGPVKGYDFNDFVIYYLLVETFSLFSTTSVYGIVNKGVRTGRFVNLFTKPITVRAYLLMNSLAHSIAKLFVRLPTVMALLLVFGDVGTVINVSLLEIALLILYLSLFFMVMFFWELCWSQLIFLLKEGSGIFGIVYNIREVCSGSLIPIDILPIWVAKIILVTPFANGIFLPASYAMGRSNENDMFRGLVLLVMWMLLFWVVVSLVWPKVRRQFGAVGT